MTLLNNDIIELIDSNGFTCVVTPNGKAFSLGSLSDAFSNTVFTTTLGRVEKRFNMMFKPQEELVNKTLLSAERSLLPADTNKLIDEIKREVTYDINNGNLSERLHISDTGLDTIDEIDIYKILRLADINMNLILASELRINNVLIDAEAKTIISDKFSPVIKSTGTSTRSTDVFSKIANIKNLPNFSMLLQKGVICLEDILDVRNNMDGRLFRKWFNDTAYNYEETIRILMDRPKFKLHEKLIKATRTFLPDIIGVLNPIAGVASSVIDSYVIDRILKGWHPSIFLDEKLKTQIDLKVDLYNRNQKKKRMEKLFPNVERNSPCPCGSGKKYKKCCGF